MLDEIKKTNETKMQKAVENFDLNLSKIRTGRANVGLLDHVHVEYHGSKLPISQVANVTVSDAQTLAVQPWESFMTAKIDKAIRESDLGLNPLVQGHLLRIPMPILTQERRKELIKIVSADAEEAKVVIRNIRRDGNQHLKKALEDKLITEDQVKSGENAIQQLTDKYVSHIDKLANDKEKELLKI